MSLQLIDNANQWHKLWSVRIAIATAVLNAAAAGWSLFQGNINPLVFAAVNMGLSCAVAGARVIQQNSLGGPDAHS